MNSTTTTIVSLAAGFLAVPIFLAVLRILGMYAIVRERQCIVFELFGTVRAVMTRPGLHFPWLRMGPMALLVAPFGKKHVVDLRLDQTYLRSEAVNSEEGAPMGIGVWYELMVSDPVSFLFKNADPAGSLRANVSSATVRRLSNMKLERMLVDRHGMSGAVRDEVTRASQEWGYQVGSIYIRKVHFRDAGMIHQIEQKVVNRLRQVTAAIQQDGANRVNLIRSAAEREASVEFAKAGALRPQIVGAALAQIGTDPEIAEALFKVLETQQLLGSRSLQVTRVPAGTSVIASTGAAVPGTTTA